MVKSNLLVLIFTIAFAVYSSAYPQVFNEEEDLEINTIANEPEFGDVTMPPKIPTELPTEGLEQTMPTKTVPPKSISNDKPTGIPDFGNHGGMKGLPEFNSTHSGSGMKGLPHGGMNGGFPKFNHTSFGHHGGFPKFNNTIFGGHFPKFNHTSFGHHGGFPKYNNTMFGSHFPKLNHTSFGHHGGFPKFNNTMFGNHFPKFNHTSFGNHGGMNVPGTQNGELSTTKTVPKRLPNDNLPTSKTIPKDNDVSLPTTKTVPVPPSDNNESLPSIESLPTKTLPVAEEEDLPTPDFENEDEANEEK